MLQSDKCLEILSRKLFKRLNPNCGDLEAEPNISKIRRNNKSLILERDAAIVTSTKIANLEKKMNMNVYQE